MRRRSKAIVLMDALVATALVGVLLTASLATMTSMSQARRATESRAIAIELAASAIERARGLSWPQLTTENLNEIARKSDIGRILPRAEMKLTLESATSDPTAKHIWVEIAWTNTTGGTVAPVRLDYWAYPPAGAAP